MPNFRDILLADTSGKLYKRFIRQKCVPFLDDYILDSMCGGFKKRGVDFCSHFVRGKRAMAGAPKKSFSSLFMDVKSAFATVIRFFALQPKHQFSDLEICKFLNILDLSLIFP